LEPETIDLTFRLADGRTIKTLAQGMMQTDTKILADIITEVGNHPSPTTFLDPSSVAPFGAHKLSQYVGQLSLWPHEGKNA
jgi:hypothetical protein